MSRKFFVSRDYYQYRHYIYKSDTFIFEPGLTVLIGCNGAGKTTLLKEIHKQLEKKDEAVIFFRYDQDRMQRDSRMQTGDANHREFFSWVSCSEGEQIRVRLENIAYSIGKFINKNKHRDIFLLIDGVDSGFSLDNIVDLKEQLFRVIIKDFETLPNDIYIICSANAYEMAAGEDCINVISGEHVRFKSYAGYRRCIIGTRTAKNKRK